MKVNLFTVPQYCCSKNDKRTNQLRNKNVSPSFQRLTAQVSLSRNIPMNAASFVKGPNVTPDDVMARIYKIYMPKWLEPPSVVKTCLEKIHRHLYTEDALLNRRTAIFINSLVDRISPKQKTNEALENIGDLTERYQKHKSARVLMQEFAEEKTADGKYRFSIDEMISPRGLFGGSYAGTEVQNEVMRFVKNIMDDQINPRFLGFDIAALRDITPKQFKQIVRPLLLQTIDIPLEITGAAFKRITDAYKQASVLAQENKKNMHKLFSESMHDSPLRETGKKRYLVKDIYGSVYIKGIIDECTEHPEKLAIFERLLPKTEEPKQVFDILKAYSEKTQAKFEKYMQDADKGKIYIGTVPFWMGHKRDSFLEELKF